MQAILHDQSCGKDTSCAKIRSPHWTHPSVYEGSLNIPVTAKQHIQHGNILHQTLQMYAFHLANTSGIAAVLIYQSYQCLHDGCPPACPRPPHPLHKKTNKSCNQMKCLRLCMWPAGDAVSHRGSVQPSNRGPEGAAAEGDPCCQPCGNHPGACCYHCACSRSLR